MDAVDAILAVSERVTAERQRVRRLECELGQVQRMFAALVAATVGISDPTAPGGAKDAKIASIPESLLLEDLELVTWTSCMRGTLDYSVIRRVRPAAAETAPEPAEVAA